MKKLLIAIIFFGIFPVALVPIGLGAVDLTISEIDVNNSNPIVGDAIKVTTTIKNIGNETPNTTVYIDTYAKDSGGSQVWSSGGASITTIVLGHGQSYSVPFTTIFKPDKTDTFTLYGVADSNSWHVEDNETNNILTKQLIVSPLPTPSPTPIPDTTPPTVSTVTPTSAIPNKQVTFSASVSDNAIIKECKLVKDGTNYTATVSAEKASYTFSSGLPEGTYNLYFECTDTSSNVGKGTSATITIVKQPLKIAISLPKTAYYPAENLEPKVTITDSSGTIVTDATVKSNITGPKPYYPYFFYSTLCDCYKSFHWLGEDVLVGDYTLYFEASHPDHKSSVASTTFKIIKPTIQTFTITTDKTEYFSGDYIIATVTAKDSFGNTIKNLYIPGELRDADTGKLIGPIYFSPSEDVYSYKYYLGSESVGKNYKFSAGTTWKEQKANATITVAVTKRGLNADVVLEKNVLSPGDSLRGRIKVYDKDGNVVKDASVSVNVKDSNGFVSRYLTTTFKDGVYEIESWKIEDWMSVGKYTLEIKVSKYPEEITPPLEKSIEITKQKLNVEVSMDRSSYKPGDNMHIKILVAYPNGTIAKDAWVSEEIFPLTSEPYVTGKEPFKTTLCRVYESPISPVYYKGEFIQKYFLDSVYMPTDCPNGKYVLKVKVSASGYGDTEILKEFDVALAKLFIETGFHVDSQTDSVKLLIYAEVKDENGKVVEFATVDGELRPAEEFKGCVKQFTLYYDKFRSRYVGDQFLSRYECTEGSYIIQLKASSMSYETADVVQGVSIQYKQGYEYKAYVPATPYTESACREVSCGPNCVQKVCEPITEARECFNFVTDEACVRSCQENVEKEEETVSKTSSITGQAIATTTDLKDCIEKCTMKVPCQGAGVPTVPIELMISKLDEIKKTVEETQEDVGALKQILLFIIDFVNSILSRYTGQEQAIKIPSEVVENATNTTNPITGAFVRIFK